MRPYLFRMGSIAVVLGGFTVTVLIPKLKVVPCKIARTCCAGSSLTPCCLCRAFAAAAGSAAAAAAATAAAVQEEDVTRLLHSLSCAKYAILNKEPAGRTISKNDKFKWVGAGCRGTAGGCMAHLWVLTGFYCRSHLSVTSWLSHELTVCIK